ncbi:MAG TPA: dicarboxylate/amino acid:cation symporter [Elusimicrobiota bacterium]|jgi:DAACS family dicarboxylate/amino acid:cation (Na+ or H+) symporter|nr:dicarboxylate/amino acid:cation symporter [Elusimicrobiota bacterium]
MNKAPWRWPLYAQTLAAMALGVAVGLLGGAPAGALGGIARAIVSLIKAFATPLLFFAILDAILQAQVHGRRIAALLAACLFDGACACAIAVAINRVFEPGAHFAVAASAFKALPEPPSWSATLAAMVPESLLAPFVTNALPGVIGLAILLGLVARSLEAKPESADAAALAAVRPITSLGLAASLRVLSWITRLTPLAVFGAVAKAVGEHGFALLPGLGAYLAACLGGMLLHVALVYQGWALAAGIALKRFWRETREAVVYSLGVNSSLATLPFTLKALDRLGVSPGSARLSACIGTNLNNDGILLYEVAAALFLAQAHGLHLGVLRQLGVAAASVLATVGVAGVPEAGFIALTLVLTTAGLPAESLPLLLTVDWMVGRARSGVNVLGDISVGIAIDKLAGRGSKS